MFGFVQGFSIFDVIEEVDKKELGKDELLLEFDSIMYKVLLEEIEKDEELKKMGSYYIIKVCLFFLYKVERETNNLKWIANVGETMGSNYHPLVFDLYYYFFIKDLITFVDLLVIYADDTTFIAKKWT